MSRSLCHTFELYNKVYKIIWFPIYLEWIQHLYYKLSFLSAFGSDWSIFAIPTS